MACIGRSPAPHAETEIRLQALGKALQSYYREHGIMETNVLVLTRPDASGLVHLREASDRGQCSTINGIGLTCMVG